ncbi:MAG: hypothetical protein JXA09_06675 [Anaerolineae bacterium]|nr:hypothetical protein [Anaerolineae bacterium]
MNGTRVSKSRRVLGRAGVIAVLVLLLALLSLSASLSQGPVVSTQTRDNDDGPPGVIRSASEWPLEVGVYYVADYPGTSSDLPNAWSNGWGLYNTLRGAGWCGSTGMDCFIWYNANAWEEDFKRHDWGGTNNYWVDKVDLVFYEGHGNPGLFTFKTPYGNCTHDDSYLTYSDARLSWGDGDLEYMALLSCSVLADSHELDWVWTMNHLHLLMGFETTAYDVYGFGTKFAQYINAGYRFSLAWMKACDQKQPTGVRAKVLAEEYNHFYDTRYYQYPDAWDYYYHKWEHVCGSEPARYVDVSQMQTLPIFLTPELGLDEAQAAWDNLGKAFEMPAPAGPSALGEDYWVSEVDGRELEMDTVNGLFYYVDHNELFSPTLPAGAHVLTPEDAQGIADMFLTDNGLMPGDAQFYEVVNETVQTAEAPEGGVSAAEARVVADDLVGYQVIYSRILTFIPTAQADPVSVSVVGPGSKLKVYVSPEGGGAQVAASGPGAVVGAQGGWRAVGQPAGLQPVAEVPVLPYDKVEQLFQLLEPQVALGEVPFDNPTSKEVLSYTLGYWEESTGLGQDQLYPTWVFEARYEGVADGEPLVVTGTCFIPANETYIRPLAKIASHSDLSGNILAGTVITFTAADATKPLSELGYGADLNFVLGSAGEPPVRNYDWYLNTVDPANKIGSGRELAYEVAITGGGGHDGPVSQTVILVVTDPFSDHSAQNTNTDMAAFEVVPGVFLPTVLKTAP